MCYLSVINTESQQLLAKICAVQNISDEAHLCGSEGGCQTLRQERNKASDPGTFLSFLSPKRVDTLMQAVGLVGGRGVRVAGGPIV